MDTSDLKKEINLQDAGDEMYSLLERLYPICRSITGNGVRQTFDIMKDYIPLTVDEVPTGTPVFDWVVPREWNIEDAYIKNSEGIRIIDFGESNLHVVGYSVPVHAKIRVSDLKEHLHTIPDQPDWIPYRTSYYKEDWGFCLAHNDLIKLKDDEYEVFIDSRLEIGSLTFGECYIKGKNDQEILFSCHVCHPSLCNDNLSGIALTTIMAKYLRDLDLNYSYRFLFIPGTIGSITWLSLNESVVHKIKHGLVLTGVGDPGKITYKRSRRGNAEIDRASEYVLKHCGDSYEIEEFSPYGYDERQYCSPGFNLPIGCFQRTPFGKYPQYHTSADDLEFVKPEYLTDSLEKCIGIVDILEHNNTYINTNPKCEPQLGKRGLYAGVGGRSHQFISQMALLWVLNLSDGHHSLLEISEKSGMEFDEIRNAAKALEEARLLERQGV